MPTFGGAATGATWVDIGGGTGANLEYFSGNLNEQFGKVVMLDLCRPLLEVQKTRIATGDFKGVDIAVVEGD